ncbi:MAG: PEP-CTERM sorting domain-containing protein [Armatimonadetes bacterium]|nr:PEP-CTERM sorting domain-containing protein [Armatimonadota bacterium]
MKSLKYLIIAGLATSSAISMASALGAIYTFSNSGSITLTSNVPGWLGDHTINTATIHGERGTDASAGLTTLLGKPASYDCYCVEIGQGINSTYQAHASVTTLLGSSTNTGGVTGPIFFDAVKVDRLERLWGTFKSGVNSSTTAAAFQLAVWKTTFDTSLNLADASSVIYIAPSNSNPATVLAQSYLNAVASGAASSRQQLLLLSDPNIQDQITAVPEPASLLALGVVSALVVARRRRKVV